MRNRLLVSAAILVAGVAVAAAHHAPGGASQDRQPRSHDARSHDGQSRRSQGDVAGKAAQPQRTRTNKASKVRTGSAAPQSPSHRNSASRAGQGASTDSATKTTANKDSNQRRGPAPAAAAPQNVPAAPGTTGQGAAPAPTPPQPVEGETPTNPDGLQMPEAGSRVPAGAPQEDYKDDTLPSGGDQHR
jgi:hypothetical protein